jgi:LysM repeat protein
MLLIIVVLVIGINSINGYNKMKDKTPEATGGEILDNSDGPSKTPVEDVEGDITTEAPTEEAPTTEAPTTEAPTTEAPTTEAPTTEAPTEDPYTYYVVKMGDSLFKICQQVYGVQSNAYVEKIKAANPEVNFGELLPGVELKIPKL